MRHWAFLAAMIWLTTAQVQAQSSASLTGQVVEQNSYWASGQAKLLTRSKVLTYDGETVEVTMYGGTKDGLRMFSPDLPPLPHLGDNISARVELASHGSRALVVKELKVLELSDPDQLNYVQTTNVSTQNPTAWTAGCAQITYHPMGTSHLEGMTEFDILDDVIETWREGTEDCSFFELVSIGIANHSVEVDGINLIRFYDTADSNSPWCPAGTTTQANGMPCFPNAAAAITTVTSEDATGRIVDADIEINGITFSISNDGETLDPNPGCFSDLANAMTHEFGHLMGLDHTCSPSAASRPIDHECNRVPVCSPTNPADVLATTMYASQTCGETKKATPEAVDILGICDIYPSDPNPPACEPSLTQGSCSAAAALTSPTESKGKSNFVLFIIVALAALAFRFSATKRLRPHTKTDT